MTEPSNDFVLYIQKMVKEKTGKEPTYQEAKEGVDNLIGFFDLLLRIDRRNNRREYKQNKPIKK
ncbi:MAG: hypothetical protein A2359_02245 [Candidatus Moranbacteria bacterium RIFOXYB1_FULL_43_19]|nr:MAG: hypothetical protein A2184_04495 [Candidatus Moranbacteria bacterium RIFOXYA1_FULL_44_7]OGI28002.1 MAG: hypothetical protein A2359_02245 [Candidatus Moranbacteria bacterium RIFOXYB1_FULL_43_19]OGI33548.1 MAG: hypothetical protein A2420_00290 [Candidatus Moranbacteria bacterium RIFOXYC1_FULL_44_13]OGI37523.1 MAG: hypothetical protein A2612_05295 [Candidatus Moranbacteria bacterium RIFOXYD1_FULL_44_12]